MGNTYTGGSEYCNNEKTKHFIRELLKSGGMHKNTSDQHNWRDSKSDTHLSNNNIDIEAHTKVNCTPTEDIKNYDIRHYTQQSCINLLRKLELSNNFADIDKLMFSLYNREKEKDKKEQWGEGGIIHINKEIKDCISTDTKLRKGIHLDYGCGGGKTSKDIIKLCKVSKSYGVDVKNNMIEEMKTSKEYKGKVIFVKNYNIHTIRDHKEIKDETVDIITAMQTFHHNNFKNATDYTRFGDRIRYVIETLIIKLKPGGYLLIREHNVENDNEAYPIMLKHLIYTISEITDTTLSISDIKRITQNYHTNIDYKAWYMSYRYLHNIIIEFNMELVISRYNYDEPKDPQRIYNSLYKKKGTVVDFHYTL